MADKTIGVSEATAQDLGRVASKNKVSRDMAISKMLMFFQTYGIDPFNYEAPHEEMTKIIKRFDQMFAFLKKQEKSILIPTLTSLASKEETEQLIKNSAEYTGVNANMILKEIIKLQNENVELKNQLANAQKKNNEEHQIIVDNVSKMLQTVIGTIPMAKKTNEAIQDLKNYEC